MARKCQRKAHGYSALMISTFRELFFRCGFRSTILNNVFLSGGPLQQAGGTTVFFFYLILFNVVYC